MKFVLLLALAVLAYLYFTGQLVAKGRGMSVGEARGVLGLPDNADAEAVRAAHRRLVAQVHPDKGGSTDLTARINMARDILLKDMNRSAPRA